MDVCVVGGLQFTGSQLHRVTALPCSRLRGALNEPVAGRLVKEERRSAGVAREMTLCVNGASRPATARPTARAAAIVDKVISCPISLSRIGESCQRRPGTKASLVVASLLVLSAGC